jgi:hypothetical protein
MRRLKAYGRFRTITCLITRVAFRSSGVETVGRDSAVGIASRCGLDGSGIESRWGERFSALVQTVLGAYRASYTMRTGSFPGVKRPGRGVDHSPPTSAEVKERVKLFSTLELHDLL